MAAPLRRHPGSWDEVGVEAAPTPGMSRRKGSGEECREMDYLFVKLFWYLVPAFVGGLVVGWIACRPSED